MLLYSLKKYDALRLLICPPLRIFFSLMLPLAILMSLT
jgi:hypothetical protein